MKRTKFRNLGTSALQLVYVAKGSLIGTYISCPKLWDFAAGAIIVENAGGMFTDWQGQKVFPVDVNSYERKPFEILAANKNAYPQLLEIMKS